jgi:hypothetical protein
MVRAALVILTMLASGCYYVTAPRKESPLYRANGAYSIAVVSVGVADDFECDVGRDDKRRIANEVVRELADQLVPGAVTLVDRRQEQKHPIAIGQYPDTTTMDEPVDVPEPLVLAVSVRQWPCVKSSAPRVDVAFALWTRDAQLVELQTVTGELGASLADNAYSIQVTPGRPAPFRNMSGLIGNADPVARAHDLGFLAVDKFVSAYIPHTDGWYNAVFSPKGHSKPGIKLARKGLYVDAIRSWQQAADETGRGEPLFNIGSLLVVDGQPDRALLYFAEARKRGYTDMEWVVDAARRYAAVARPLPMPAGPRVTE